jgi:hypothetical protein
MTMDRFCRHRHVLVALCCGLPAACSKTEAPEQHKPAVVVAIGNGRSVTPDVIEPEAFPELPQPLRKAVILLKATGEQARKSASESLVTEAAVTLAGAGVRTGNRICFDEARKLIDSLPNARSREMVLVLLVEAEARSAVATKDKSLFEQAKKTAAGIADAKWLVAALCKIAEAEALAGNAEWALATYREAGAKVQDALPSGNPLADPEVARSEFRESMVQSLIQAAVAKQGNAFMEEALRTAAAIKDEGRRAGAYRLIAEGQASAAVAGGDRALFAAAIQTAERIPEQPGLLLAKGMALGQIAAAQLEAGDKDAYQATLKLTMATARAGKSAAVEGQILRELATMLGRLAVKKKDGGLFVEALQHAQTIRDEFERKLAVQLVLRQRALAAAVAGDRALMADAAVGLRQAMAVADLAESQALLAVKLGDKALLGEAYRSVGGLAFPGQVQKRIATAQAALALKTKDAALLAQALENAGKIKLAEARAVALREVAAAHARFGAAAKAKAAFAQALQAATEVESGAEMKAHHLRGVAVAQGQSGLYAGPQDLNIDPHDPLLAVVLVGFTEGTLRATGFWMPDPQSADEFTLALDRVAA